MKDYVALKVLDRFRRVLESLDCEYAVLRRILQIKLTMDRRRIPTIFSGGAGRKKRPEAQDKNIFMRSLWIYAFMGLVTVPFVLMNQNYVFQMSITFGILMFLIMTSMIADFSSVLLDIRDRVIIATKPVNARTLNFARAIHVTIYLFLLTGALAGPPLLAALLGHGIVFFLLFLAALILMDIFILVVTALLYLLILNFFDGERLKDVINYVQIALSVAILVGYQLVGRSFAVLRVHIVFQTAWWQVAVPPMWFGSAFEWILRGRSSPQLVLLSITALIIPIVLFVIYIRLMPTFESRLQKLSANNDQGKIRRVAWSRLISRFICTAREERTFFSFASLMLAREREFKLKVYPSLGLSTVFPFILIFNMTRSIGLRGLAFSHWYLSIYMIALLIPTVVMMLRYSAQYKGAWVYRTAPVQNITAIFKGAIKAFFVRLFIPIFLIDSTVFVTIFGMRIVPDLIVVLLTALLYTVICFRVVGQRVPFSEPFQVVQQSDRFVVLPLLLLIGVFAAIHFALTFVHFGIYYYMLVLLLLNAWAWRMGFRLRRVPQLPGS